MAYGKAVAPVAARPSPYSKPNFGGKGQAVPGSKVYVGNLSYKTNWHTLKELFSQVGTVVYSKVLREDGPGGKGSWSRGTGLVEFASAREAQQAIATLNQAEVDGRTILVDKWDESAKSSPAKGSGKGAPWNGSGSWNGNGVAWKGASGNSWHNAGKGQGKFQAAGEASATFNDDPACKVYVGNLAYTTKWAVLKEFFSQVGTVTYAKVMEEKGKGKGFWSKGTGLVVFATPQEAQAAIASLNGAELEGREIKLDVWTAN